MMGFLQHLYLNVKGNICICKDKSVWATIKVRSIQRQGSPPDVRACDVTWRQNRYPDMHAQLAGKQTTWHQSSLRYLEITPHYYTAYTPSHHIQHTLAFCLTTLFTDLSRFSLSDILIWCWFATMHTYNPSILAWYPCLDIWHTLLVGTSQNICGMIYA